MPLLEKTPGRELSEFDKRWARAMKVQREILRQYGVMADLSVKALPGAEGENRPEAKWKWTPDALFAPKAKAVFPEGSPKPAFTVPEETEETVRVTPEGYGAASAEPEATSPAEDAPAEGKKKFSLRGAAAAAAAAAAIAVAPLAGRKGAAAAEETREPIVREPVAGPEVPGPDEKEASPAATEDPAAEKTELTKQALRGVIRGVKALTGLVVTVIVRVFLAVLTGSVPFLGGPAGTLIGSAITFFLCALILVSALFKLFFPDRKLSELWTKKGLLILCAASVLHGLAEAVVPRVLSGMPAFLAALALTVFDAALVFAALRLLLGKLRDLPGVGKLLPSGGRLWLQAGLFALLAVLRALLAAHTGVRVYASAAVLFCLMLGAFLLFRRIAPKAEAPEAA